MTHLFKKVILSTLIATGLSTVSVPVLADNTPVLNTETSSSVETMIRQAVAKKSKGQAVIDSIKPAIIKGLYEIQIGTDILYADSTGQYFIIGGHIKNLDTDVDYTQDKIDALSIQSVFEPKNLANALKLVKGNGKRVLAVFEDTNCGYCKKLRQEFESLTDVTIYTYLVPILSQDSDTKFRNIWCAKDKNKAYDDLMIKKIDPETADERCAATVPVDANKDLQTQLGIRGTPTLFFSHGKRIPGFIKAPQIEQYLNDSLNTRLK